MAMLGKSSAPVEQTCFGRNCSDEGAYLLQRKIQGGLYEGVATEESAQRATKGGAKWSEHEMHVIQQTLYQMFSWQQGSWENQYCQLLRSDEYPCVLERFDPNRQESCDSENITEQAARVDVACNGIRKKMSRGAVPTAPKFLRLGFHDCFRYTDKTGGCDGCLNFNGMFTIFNIDERPGPDSYSKSRKTNLPYNMGMGNNNNLAATADFLEEIYTNVGWGKQKGALTVSLKDSGKSRADLWAYTTLVASQFFMDRNNMKCWSSDEKHLYKEPTLQLPHQCEITPTRRFRFYTGRVDCPESDKPPPHSRVREYQTEKEEAGNNAHWTGKEVAEWFAAEFDFTGRETVAIMGAHQAGAYAAENSLFRYTWGGREMGHEGELNNLYYRMMAYKPLYFDGDLDYLATAKADGAPVPMPRTVSWEMNPRALCPNSAPIQWHMFTYPPSEGTHNFTYPDRGQSHIVMINTDMGLYLNFETIDDGFPVRANDSHCTTLGTKSSHTHRMMPFDVAMNSCRQNYPGGDGKTLADIVEEYADDQNKWWNDYVLALEKMLANGYQDGELEFSGDVFMLTTTTTTTTLLDACTKTYCCGGSKKQQHCCAGSCGKCGGGGCKKRPGGRALCCESDIKKNGIICQHKWDVGCMIPY